jgi:hypothetical protein
MINETKDDYPAVTSSETSSGGSGPKPAAHSSEGQSPLPHSRRLPDTANRTSARRVHSLLLARIGISRPGTVGTFRPQGFRIPGCRRSFGYSTCQCHSAWWSARGTRGIRVRPAAAGMCSHDRDCRGAQNGLGGSSPGCTLCR